ncbi:1-acyl-sn-glycerol-3-phosphate acyltransferase [Rickettsiales endosymbiont of Paramecium tredecaurelia]|uniref:lysophospholipid acyltransferase family protein n=1 Tax=Candidatus Sarmatiella mevalonica TaxID=2770581 RepID=UPI001920ECFD|nr:lysophospholipid acyltransferase family protein [Candidatus Sarmatiella mevalonica]MBL3284667.1 1-acyl-sn-glycerol-3-phosphate acyltransferase [Candidatus Sarmatiella mevalonica]
MLDFIWHLRVLLFYLVVSIFTITFFTISAVPLRFCNLSYDTKYLIVTWFSRGFILICKLICNLDYKITGIEKLPKEPCVVMANHQSFWDNIIMQLIIPKHSWIIKRELFDIPFFGWGLKLVEPIAVDRTERLSVKQILEYGAQKLSQGLWIVIFPESTRLNPDQTARFKPSGLKLAQVAEVPVVLLAHNAGVYWPKGFWIKKPGVIDIRVLDVISKEELEQFDVRTLNDKAENLINTNKQMLLQQSI